MTALLQPIESILPAQARTGVVSGGVRSALPLEGAAALLAAAVLYAEAGYSWRLFALGFLVPDVAMLAYFAGPRVGAVVYNLAHTYALAVALALAGFIGGEPAMAAAALIWIAHIGFDRALGFGLKYASGFGDTHLGRTGHR